MVFVFFFLYNRKLYLVKDHPVWRGGMVRSKMQMRQPKRLLKVWSVWTAETHHLEHLDQETGHMQLA